MFGAILKATNSSFQKGMTFCRSIYVKKVMKLLAFIFEQPSYSMQNNLTVCVILFNLICTMTIFQKKLNFGLAHHEDWTKAFKQKSCLICFISIVPLPVCKIS